jgi:imidazolonepropionase-like amidohydrolase
MRIVLAMTILTVLGIVPAHAAVHHDKILLQGNPAGEQTVDMRADGSVHAEYSYNDRGRGDHIVATGTLDAAGIPIRYAGSGNDYMKAPVAEHFTLKDGKASWQNRAEQGETAITRPAFYVPANAPPAFLAVLARALLKAPEHKLALLPSGAASLQAAGSVRVAGGMELTQSRITGLGFTPQAIWLDAKGETSVLVSSWLSVLPDDRVGALAALRAAQDKADNAWSARLARELAHVPKGDLVIRDARLFDPRDLSVTPGASVLIRGERIVRVALGGELKTVAADAEIIDAHGRFLMPGLWDNHQHIGEVDGALDIVNGVTSARDMANDTDGFLKRVARFDAGTEIGPRVLKAGVIDGTGEFAGPTKMRVDNAADALKDVDWYADHGYTQIKIYSSVKPELVPIIADRAHELGLRVSGHVPAFMSAREFVEGGADEIQHLNFIELNFLYPQVRETRNRDRFIKVAEHAREFTPEQPQVAEFIAFLRRRHTVLDPTMNVFEALFSGDPAAVTPGLEDIVPRFPPQVRRGMHSEALEIPQGQEEAWHAAFPAMLTLLKALYDAGITIIPGTDTLAGYTLHHELELYVRAGIAPAEVLRMATLTSAQVMGVQRERGVVMPGSYADMVLIDGDPLKNIADARKVVGVIKDGRVYDPVAIEQALGIASRAAK